MTTAASISALLLAMAAVGTSALLWLAPTFGAVRQGYEWLTGATVVLFAWGAWASLDGPLQATQDTAAAVSVGQARHLLVGLIVVSVVALVVRSTRAPLIITRALGATATAIGIAAFVPLAAIRAEAGGAGGLAQGIVELVVGAGFLGAIWVGMILGHWYLVERRLSNRYMVWIAWANVAAVGMGLASVLLSARNPTPCQGLVGAAFQQCAMTFAPVLRIGAMTVWLGLGVLALVALIAGFNVRLAKEGGRSIQASTGMFYLAVILAPAVEFAAKVRFYF